MPLYAIIALIIFTQDFGTPIFKQNKTNVVESLEAYISHLEHFKELMKKEDFEGVFKQMEDTNYIKKILKGIN